MTPIEAIEKIRKQICNEKGVQRYCRDNCMHGVEHCAYSMAIKALEKQLPKKPLHNGANWYRCPNGCEVHKKAFEKDWYCPKCGQRLEWENEHDGE